eukprot:GHVQ01021123.1.p1 GENE.GHVQ01021123.1~~GHVQ01021123.1.p1  ORF type:complete len:551 (+),score=135.53 GHVQ01021123.1:746-2398(+)
MLNFFKNKTGSTASTGTVQQTESVTSSENTKDSSSPDTRIVVSSTSDTTLERICAVVVADSIPGSSSACSASFPHSATPTCAGSVSSSSSSISESVQSSILDTTSSCLQTSSTSAAAMPPDTKQSPQPEQVLPLSTIASDKKPEAGKLPATGGLVDSSNKASGSHPISASTKTATAPSQSRTSAASTVLSSDSTAAVAVSDGARITGCGGEVVSGSPSVGGSGVDVLGQGKESVKVVATEGRGNNGKKKETADDGDCGTVKSVPKILGSKTKEEFEADNNRMREELSTLRKKLSESQMECGRLRESLNNAATMLSSATKAAPVLVKDTLAFLEFAIAAGSPTHAPQSPGRRKNPSSKTANHPQQGKTHAGGTSEGAVREGYRGDGGAGGGAVGLGKGRPVYRIRQATAEVPGTEAEGKQHKEDRGWGREGGRAARVGETSGMTGSTDVRGGARRAQRGGAKYRWTEVAGEGGRTSARENRNSAMTATAGKEQQEKTDAIKELLRAAETVETMKEAIKKAEEAKMTFEVELAHKKLSKITKDMETAQPTPA